MILHGKPGVGKSRAPVKDIPLTGEQSDLVARWFPYAMTAANRRSFGRGDAARERIHDVAIDALIATARRFDPSAGPGFFTLLRWRLRGKISDVIRRRVGIKTRGPSRVRRLAPRFVPADPRSGADISSFDLEDVLGMLPMDEWYALAACDLEGYTQGEHARLSGLRGDRVSRLRRCGIERLRSMLG